MGRALPLLRPVFVVVLLLSVSSFRASEPLAAGPFPSPSGHVWPISGTTTPDAPISSTFGPRQKSSESSRFDWHRGIDLPTPCLTPLRAIADGVARLSGDYPGTYSDRVVQLCHLKPGAPADACGKDANGDGRMDDNNGDGVVDSSTSTQAYYSNYIHMATTAVVPGQVVSRGTVVGGSGDSGIGYTGVCQPDTGPTPGGFDHLHFEIRDGGVLQRHAVHPLLVLPHNDASAQAITLASVDVSNPLKPVVRVTATNLAGELDFNAVEVTVFDQSSGAPVKASSHRFDINEWTLKYSATVAILDTDPKFDGVYSDTTIFGADAGVTVAPAAYSSTSTVYTMDITFWNLTGASKAENLLFQVAATDARGTLGAGQSQTITLGQAPVVAVNTTATVSATASSGLPVTLTALTPAVCSVSGATVRGLATGQCTLVASQSGNASFRAAAPVAQSFAVIAATSLPRLVNISTRARVQTGDNVMIAGFIIGGDRAKKVLINARGPSLAVAPHNVPGTLADPALQIFSGATPIDSNDDYQSRANWTDIPASIRPPNVKEAAILTTLNPGAYTAIVTGTGATTGVAIVEVFEIELPEIPLINLSTRARVETGDNVMIAGFIIEGNAPKTVVVTARGPSLAAAPFNVPDTLADPYLRLYSGQTVIYENDNWADWPTASQIPESQRPKDAKDAAVRVTLAPGAYTVIVGGGSLSAGSGVAIVEVFVQ